MPSYSCDGLMTMWMGYYDGVQLVGGVGHYDKVQLLDGEFGTWCLAGCTLPMPDP